MRAVRAQMALEFDFGIEFGLAVGACSIFLAGGEVMLQVLILDLC